MRSRLLAKEFGFSAEGAVVVGHKKQRHGLEGAPYHLHLLVREVDALTGRVLGTSWDYARQEKVSRTLEARWGHSLVSGRWNSAVVAALQAEGAPEADYLVQEGLASMPKAEGRWKKGLDKELERRTGRRMPEVAEAVADARALSGGEVHGFVRMLSEAGLRVEPGDKPGRWVVQARDQAGEWQFAGALNRLAKMKVDEADDWIRPVLSARETGEEQTNEQDEPSLEIDGLRGGQGRNARRGRAARRGSKRDADGIRGGPGQRDDGRSVDVVAGPGAGGRRGFGAGADRGPAGGTGPATEGADRTPEGSRRLALLSRQESGGHATGGGGHRARKPSLGGPDRGALNPPPFIATARHVRALRDIEAIAGLQWQFGSAPRLDWLAQEAGEARPAFREMADGVNRTIRTAESEKARRKRKAAFLAVLLRRAYSLSAWLSPETLLHLQRVDIDARTGTVLITLTTGTRILDTGDKVTIRGPIEDLAIKEMVACAARRVWQSVEVTGSHEFRVAASRALLADGIDVVDSPLSPGEQAALRGEGVGFDWSVLGDEERDVPVPAPRPPWAEVL